ncbi:MAG: SMP-30/gluconolactonase/LRE family protein [Novosphingobium sp.]|nr:SMP-30/gluconolactonase/LRE family protein [Novosphingobium sp.]
MEFEVIAEGLDFPEGPVVMEDGSIIVVETDGGRITRCWSGGRKEVVATPGGGPNGLAVGADGALYHCNNGGHEGVGDGSNVGRIERIDIATGKVERIYESCDGDALSAPNDIMFDLDGQMWFTDLGRIGEKAKDWGGLYCASPDGSKITRVVERALSYNGVGISPDMSTVYAADTYSARLWAVDRKAELQKPRLVGTAPGPVFLDSLGMTAAGNVAVAAVTGGAIATFTPSGDVTMTPVDDRVVTNIAFGGEDMMDAWLTFSGHGTLVKTRWFEPGMKLLYNA